MSSEPQGHVILGPAGMTLEILKCHRWGRMSHGGRTRRGRIPGMSNLLQAVGQACVTASDQSTAELMTSKFETN